MGNTQHKTGYQIPEPLVNLSLDFPPSSNRLYRNTRKGRAKTVEYENWIKRNLYLLHQQNINQFVSGYYGLQIDVPAKINKNGKVSKRQPDIDNMSKAITDLLVEFGITPDDSYQSFKIVRRVAPESGMVLVGVFESEQFLNAPWSSKFD